MTRRRSGIAFALSLFTLSVIACGGGGSESGNGTSGQASSSSGSSPDTTGGTSSGDPNGGPVCVGQEVAAARKPVKLVIILDQSRSMGGDANSARWVPVTKALNAILGEQSSVGIEANMRLFPKAGASGADKCKSLTYKAPNVPMTILPNAAPFVSKLVANPGTDDYRDTPTRAVLKAAVVDAKEIAKKNTGARVAIVLITADQPRGCSTTDNDIDNVASEVAGTKDTIPTYVIGVGDQGKLDPIATTGGPREAFLVTDGEESKTQAEFRAAMDEIRGASIACDVDIPPPPEGKALDPLKVNVNYAPVGKAVEPLDYDEGCTGAGWRYDDKAAPKQVILCPTTCTAAKKDPSAKLSVSFGCVTRIASVP